MKIFNTILEILTSPFSFLLKISGTGRNFLSSLAKAFFIFIIALLITLVLVLYYYRDFIFNL